MEILVREPELADALHQRRDALVRLCVVGVLQRVAIGFGIAAVVGVVVGCVIGQSVWVMRGLDPIFQVLRTVPPLAWLDPPSALQVLRLAQEMFTNVLKHARARHVHVSLRRVGDDVQVEIADDGVGCPARGWTNGRPRTRTSGRRRARRSPGRRSRSRRRT